MGGWGRTGDQPPQRGVPLPPKVVSAAFVPSSPPGNTPAIEGETKLIHSFKKGRQTPIYSYFGSERATEGRPFPDRSHPPAEVALKQPGSASSPNS